jgi:diamine N-acetyltransferase
MSVSSRTLSLSSGTKAGALSVIVQPYSISGFLLRKNPGHGTSHQWGNIAVSVKRFGCRRVAGAITDRSMSCREYPGAEEGIRYREIRSTSMFLSVSTENQLEIVESLAREIWTEHYVPIIGEEQVAYMLSRFQSKEAIAEQIASGMFYYLMRENNKFIGYIAVQQKGQELFLSKIYVKLSKRGRGYGRKAIHFAETLAKERSLTKIVLTVNKNNVNSIKAYEKMGFKNSGSIIQDIGSDFVMDDFTMDKSIG